MAHIIPKQIPQATVEAVINKKVYPIKNSVNPFILVLSKRPRHKPTNKPNDYIKTGNKHNPRAYNNLKL
jgi:hypothetical protein